MQLPAGMLLRLAALDPARYPVLFDSAAQGRVQGGRSDHAATALGTVSILAALPQAAIWQDVSGVTQTAGLPGVPRGAGFLDTLDACWRRERISGPPPGAGSATQLPFRGGWVVFLGYEIAQEIEPHLQLPHEGDEAALPRAFALRTPAALIQDAATGKAHLVAEAHVDARELDEIEHDIRRLSSMPQEPMGQPPLGAAIIEEDPQRYIERVVRAQEYIRAGDIYQANLSRLWQVELDAPLDVHALYARLRNANPGPFAALAQWEGRAILSSSPERLMRISGDVIDTRPIAGTRPRSPDAAEDQRLAQALIEHPKERAEHVMLIDLERNDLGRVCVAGSVRVDEYMVLESYAHVHHIVSNVSGRLRPDVGPVQALRAVFPGGTITGCPKFRCMQIIAELEQSPRGAYTGSLGYVNLDGSADFNILIRTIAAWDMQLDLRAGAGIVADSVPERELAETRAKARGLLAALG